ncbi:MAG: hypothetical protein GAK30_01576 [Paracidovorax wautersii]|uniref:Uncharacterized protein n=1 Tax=Paracidovorax wautersii TaxID=1177982 RepID=A0A7V8FPR6_9BURK|nr:MAG: hypothetical protein GAK30_01576 [Paracidovorax wautersii]
MSIDDTLWIRYTKGGKKMLALIDQPAPMSNQARRGAALSQLLRSHPNVFGCEKLEVLERLAAEMGYTDITVGVGTPPRLNDQQP